MCVEYMRPPIILCANGHNICDICKPKMHHCPICREQFLNTRNLALEDLARQFMYPCKCRSYGCTDFFNPDKIVGHQATCRYSPQICPIAKLAIGNCSWTGSYNDIKGHLQENHLEGCYECTEGGIQFLYRLTLRRLMSYIYTHIYIYIYIYILH